MRTLAVALIVAAAGITAGVGLLGLLMFAIEAVEEMKRGNR